MAVSGRFIIVVGDKSTHGGVIITGDPIATVNGIPIARVGDFHACPQIWPKGTPHGVRPIIGIRCAFRGLSNGRPQAVAYDMVGCGAMICDSAGWVLFCRTLFLLGVVLRDCSSFSAKWALLLDSRWRHQL